MVAAIFAALALAVLLPPLAGRRSGSPAPDKDQVNAAVYQARLKELEAEVALGALDAEDFVQAKLELERELLASRGGAPVDGAGPAAAPRRTALVVAVLLPILALGVYLKLGSPEAITAEPPAPAAAMPAADGEVDRDALERMVATFAKRLADNPDQGDGWVVLGQAYMMLEDYEKAVLSFAHARMLLGDSPDLLVDLAEAEALSNQNRFGDDALARIEKALTLDPDHEKGLWLGAFAAAQRGDTITAVSRWRQLLEREADPQRQQLIQGLIARVEGIEESPAKGEAESTSGSSARIQVRVDLAASLRAEVDGSETVFIFARAEQGPRVPLAVYRTRVDALPVAVTLDDSMAMSPEFRLSPQKRVRVIARVSKSGNAQAQSGDFEGQSGTVTVGKELPVEISIDQRVP